MNESGSGSELIDRVVDMVMRGQDPDVEGLIASTPDMPPSTREKLRKIAGTFGPGRFAAPVTRERDAELPFAELGPYKLLSRMGEGGMGCVYLAEHGFLRRRVALKVIRPELAFSESTRERFHREAMSIARLRHDNIVSVYDAGEHGGVAFLAMELVDGQGLDEVLQAARQSGEHMDVIAAVRHARDIALALQSAHDAGVIHRDVKPSNVRIASDGRALLLDFGLSLAEDLASGSSIGLFRGTPQHASPEQIESNPAGIDGRTDVYSLGITLYECLTGRVPFEGASLNQLFRQILAGDPVEPRKLNHRVDDALNGIVMRALATRRENRFGSAADMARALEAWLQAGEHVAPTTRRAESGVRASLLAAGLLVIGTGAWLAFRTRESAVVPSPRTAQPIVLAPARITTPLLGELGIAFDQHLAKWDPLIGGGTFGADEDGAGVIGTCVDGITGQPRVLPGGNGRVRGRIEPIAPKPGVRTRGAGAGIEFSNGRVVALLLIPASDGYELRLCELNRDRESRLTHGTELGSGKGTWTDGQPLVFALSWNDTDTQFDWADAVDPADAASLLIPGHLRETSQPSRFLLIVEAGSARFEDLVLEES